MTEYQFALKFSIKSPTSEIDAIVERLGKEGCTDALVGIGQEGLIDLDFAQEAPSAIDANKSALADMKRAISETQLVKERETP